MTFSAFGSFVFAIITVYVLLRSSFVIHQLWWDDRKNKNLDLLWNFLIIAAFPSLEKIVEFIQILIGGYI